MVDHYRFDLNEDYLIVKVDHKGSQEAALFGGVEGNQQTDEYSNTFICQPSKVQYRPPARAYIPRLNGVVNALIENTEGPYAQIDDQGRYRTSFMFDLNHPSSDGSLPIRMIQPNAGSQYGQHFPLHEKVEVLLACVNGDPDRPVVVGSVPNPNNASPSTSQNRWQNVIRSWGQNELTFDDKQDAENILLKATKDHNRRVANNESISVGSDRTKSVGHDETTSIGNNRTEDVSADETITIGQNRTETVGADETITIGSNRMTSIGVNDTQNVTENRVVNIGSHLVETIGNNLSETVGGDVVISIGKNQTVNISQSETINIGKDQTISVGGKKKENVSGDVQMSATGKVAISSAKEIVLTVGASSITIKPDGVTISGPKISSTAIGIHEISGAMVKIN
jgi:type VI secretion system secreted protein VgrG